MATNTSYLGLTKPAQSDLYNVDVFNDNADKVDANAQKTAANLATIEAVATASKPYVVGEYLVLNGILYKVTQAIANGGALVVGTNIAQDNVGTELKSIKDALPQYKTLHGSSSITIDYTGYTMIAVIGQYAGNGFIVTAYGSNAPMFLVSTTNVITATNSSSVMTLSNSSTGGFRCGILLFK